MAQAIVVTGARACFRRPEFVRDAITYDVMTPFAARGVFEAVHWTPAIRWQIERIEVINPIRTQWAVPSADAIEATARELDLIDVGYAIHADFVLTDVAGPGDNVVQHAAIFRRRLRGQRFFRSPYLGRRDLVAEARPVDPDLPVTSAYAGSGAIDLGWMLYDRDLADAHRACFFRATMVDGVIDLTAIDRGSLAC